jgi:hypothetical protein
MEFYRTQKFSKELKRLSKKYRSLANDLEKLERVLEKLPQGTGSKHWNKLHCSADSLMIIFKVRLACLSLKGQSSFRVVYACHIIDNKTVRIDYIELYYKSEKENEDRDLMKEYIHNRDNLFV